MAGHEVYEFGGCVLDVAERKLLRGGAAVTLAPRALDLLGALVRRAGMLVTKQELLDAVWRDAHVEEGILTVHVSALRKALGVDGCIETVPRGGYRFTAQVKRREAPGGAFSMRWPVGVLPAQPAVSELIGRGRSHLLAAAGRNVPKALDAFRAAIALDPEYAAAHAGLALASCAQAELRLAPLDAAYADARAAALRALAMDASNADAQVALATVLFLSDWHWAGARRSLERALEIDPDHTEALLLYGRLLEALGHLDEGLAAKQKALERDPSSAAVHMQIALSCWNQRRYDDMIAWAARSLELDPGHLLAREFIASAYLQKGDRDRHMAESLAHAKAAGAPDSLIDELRALYASGGRSAIVEYALRASAKGPAVQLAVLNAEAGRLDEAFRQLDRAIDARDPALVHLAVAPQWDALRADPRFAERLTRMGLR
jgi:DNA-binding winged helix-turn-helix (wHTH) protein/tetratricopeptide (TPR) repeat protein